MQISLNGESYEINQPLSLAELLRRVSILPQNIAVEVNQNIIPKSQHEDFVLQPGDVVEVIQAIAGG